ncbi:MAG TPA: hypothetical protein VLI06_03550, partial [Solimonas sp.]|nr:hypothetical protein [Solimonas sp.]
FAHPAQSCPAIHGPDPAAPGAAGLRGEAARSIRQSCRIVESFASATKPFGVYDRKADTRLRLSLGGPPGRACY